MRLKVFVGLMLVVSVGTACDAAVFTASGVGDGTSATFRLEAGPHRITYVAADREPFFGCKFGISLEAPVGDPLAPGRVIVQTEILSVAPNGRISDALVTPTLPAGDYFIDYLGVMPCDWTVSVF